MTSLGRFFRRNLVFLITLAVFVVIDLWSKEAAFRILGARDVLDAEHDVWPGVFKLKLVENYGMMWGMAQRVPALLWVVIRGLVLVGLMLLLRSIKKRGVITQLAFGLVAAGAVGNIHDNIFNGPELFTGPVRDFLHFYWFEFPTFNVADSCICVGAPLLLIVLWNHDKKQAAESAEASGPASPPLPR